jgi:hypothetical protein
MTASGLLVTGGAPVNTAVNVQSGMLVAPVCLVDSTGNFATGNGAVTVTGTTGISGVVSLFRDSVITAQAANTASAPTAGTVVATVTPGTAGLWEVTVTVSVSGTTVVATDSHNMQLNQTATARLSPIVYPVTGVTGNPAVATTVPVILSLSAVDTVNVKAIASATASSVYAASVTCRRVG